MTGVVLLDSVSLLYMGWHIDPDRPGRRIAQYFGVEVKAPKTSTRSATQLSPDQRAFHSWANSFGMLVMVARCVEDVDAALLPLGISR